MDMATLLQVDEPGGLAARWNFTEAIGSPAATPGGIGAAATVGYSFMQALPDYEPAIEHPGFLGFDAGLQAAAREALAAWAAVCDIGFVEVPDAGEGGVLRFGRNDMATGGFTWFPGYAYSVDAAGLVAAVEPLPHGGDIWLSTDPSLEAQAPGDYGRYALVHEIGHAIGLKHPFAGSNTLPAAEATLAHSIMAYAVPANCGVVTVEGSPESYRWTGTSLFPAGPMLLDIAAAQYLYGPNLATNAGDTHYAWAPGARFLQTLWDAGGTDVIDAGNQALACVIDLNEGHASSIGIRATEAARRAELPDWAVAAPTPSYDGRDNLWIAWGAVIEGAIGGAGDDLLIGNAADNELAGGAGNDTLIGGAGRDTAVLPGLRAETLLVPQADGSWQAVGPGGQDVLWQVEAVLFEDGAGRSRRRTGWREGAGRRASEASLPGPADRILQVVVAPEYLAADDEAGGAEQAEPARLLGRPVERLDGGLALGQREDAPRIGRLPALREGEAEVLLAAAADALLEPEAIGRADIVGAPTLGHADHRHAVGPRRARRRIGRWQAGAQAVQVRAAPDVAPHVVQLRRAGQEGQLGGAGQGRDAPERPQSDRDARGARHRVDPADGEEGVGAPHREPKVDRRYRHSIASPPPRPGITAWQC
jgi:serralysin